jgi:hypothetical protein
MLVPALWSFLQVVLAPVCGVMLSRPQTRLLQHLILARLLGCGGKLCRASRLVLGRHRTSLARLLNRSSWDAAAVMGLLAIRVLAGLRPKPGEWLDLILDDTRMAKRGRRMPGLQKIWIHAEQRFARGHLMVGAAIRFRGVVLPWRFELWLPADYCRRHGQAYRKTTAIAAELIREFTPPKGVKVRVLFDAFYLCPVVTKACQLQDFQWYSVASKNRNLVVKGRMTTVGHLGPGTLRHRGRPVRMNRDRGVRGMRIAAVDGRLPRIGDVRIVYCKRPGDPWSNLLAIVTNATTVPARQIVAHYERRWSIEVLFKELKGSLGLGEYQVQTLDGIARHLHLSGLAHLTLTHHGLRALGAQARQQNMDVSLPKFRDRMEMLRCAVREETVDRIVRRIRHPKTRTRLRKLLSST